MNTPGIIRKLLIPLADEVMATHKYPKWLKRSDRFQAVAAAAEPKLHQEQPPTAILEPPAHSAGVPAMDSPAPADSTLDLLKQAHAQLIARKEKIEAELARVGDLTKELDAVKARIEALEETLAAFR